MRKDKCGKEVGCVRGYSGVVVSQLCQVKKHVVVAGVVGGTRRESILRSGVVLGTPGLVCGSAR